MQTLEVLDSFKRYALYEKEMRPSTYKMIASVVSWLQKDTGVSQVNQYTTPILRNFLYQRKEERLWSTKSLINYRQSLKAFFDFCVKEQFISKNPVKAIDKPRLPVRLPRCLNDKQVKTLLSSITYHKWSSQLQYCRNEAIIRAFLLTGLRLNELLKLEVESVNLLEGVLYVHQGKGRKDRIVPIHPKLLPYLKQWRDQRNKSLKNSIYFFTSIRSDKPLSKNNLYAIFRALRKDCGFHFTPHMLRHTFARLTLESNLNLYHLKEIMGHTQITTTQIYMSVSLKSTQESFNKLVLL